MPSQFFRKRPTAMTRPEFVKRFGGVYEHSPWVAEAVYDARLRPAHDGVKALHVAMIEAVETAPRERRLELLRAHPDLAGRLAIRGELTPASTAEQASARLDACTPAEFDRLQELNTAYRAKFGFPFIMAVRGKTRLEILAAFERRIHNDPEAEFRTALDEVHKIALLRLGDL
jgi:2-oxo-4-hydroxy-4-carboxy-5-ureidoimidazoline decarboxylase